MWSFHVLSGFLPQFKDIHPHRSTGQSKAPIGVNVRVNRCPFVYVSPVMKWPFPAGSWDRLQLPWIKWCMNVWRKSMNDRCYWLPVSISIQSYCISYFVNIYNLFHLYLNLTKLFSYHITVYFGKLIKIWSMPLYLTSMCYQKTIICWISQSHSNICNHVHYTLINKGKSLI